MFTTSMWVSGRTWYAKPVPSNLPEGHIYEVKKTAHQGPMGPGRCFGNKNCRKP